MGKIDHDPISVLAGLAWEADGVSKWRCFHSFDDPDGRAVLTVYADGDHCSHLSVVGQFAGDEVVMDLHIGIDVEAAKSLGKALWGDVFLRLREQSAAKILPDCNLTASRMEAEPNDRDRRRHVRCASNLRVLVNELHGPPITVGRVRNFSDGGCFVEIGSHLSLVPEKGLLVRLLTPDGEDCMVGRILDVHDTSLRVQFEKEQLPDWPRICPKCTSSCEGWQSLVDEPVLGALARSIRKERGCP